MLPQLSPGPVPINHVGSQTPARNLQKPKRLYSSFTFYLFIFLTLIFFSRNHSDGIEIKAPRWLGGGGRVCWAHGFCIPIAACWVGSVVSLRACLDLICKHNKTTPTISTDVSHTPQTQLWTCRREKKIEKKLGKLVLLTKSIFSSLVFRFICTYWV